MHLSLLEKNKIVTRSEFEKYLNNQNLEKDLEKEYWRIYDKINEPGSPLTYNQRANFLLSELTKMKNN
jgi:hypothetical protein